MNHNDWILLACILLVVASLFLLERRVSDVEDNQRRLAHVVCLQVEGDAARAHVPSRLDCDRLAAP